ncbi:hypothetical protein BCV71DRAFT_266806 [Rhizopus microsporus]|uniref:Uncharacterized protein n=1 Tax=Rhizopus microsporus TaxID=58291 RepID=A0A1X0RSU7_RHIZD|nr:hypothetical protein BCV71DRAFT_266806 [Rhizopus microsporus]
MNEAEYGNLEKKYDLLLMGEILDDKNEVIDIELSSIEIKPACVADDIGQVQDTDDMKDSVSSESSGCSNKNNSISYNQDSEHIISMDIVGLNAFFYDVYQYEDVIVAVKEKEKELFLPADEDDFGEFIMGIARISYSTML